MLANMTKAAEEAAARQAKLDEAQNAKFKQHHHHAPPLHSGEIQFPAEQHSGESKGLFGKAQVLDAKQFGSKISPLDSPITLRKIQPEIQKQHYDSLKYSHAKVVSFVAPFFETETIPKIIQVKPIELKVKSDNRNTEAELLESDLQKLREEMAKMQNELVALQGDTSIVEVANDRTTIAPNLKALDLELVPKAPRPPKNGPNVPVVSSGVDGEVFLLDVPNEKGWSFNYLF